MPRVSNSRLFVVTFPTLRDLGGSRGTWRGQQRILAPGHHKFYNRHRGIEVPLTSRSLPASSIGRPRVTHLQARHRFSVENYLAMARTAILGENEKLELVDGDIVEMTPVGSRHAGCINYLNRQFVGGAG